MGRVSANGSNQQLYTLSHNIPECIEGAVCNGKGIVRAGFEGLLVDTGESNARHGFKIFV